MQEVALVGEVQVNYPPGKLYPYGHQVHPTATPDNEVM
jgi:hypothetical protein